MRCDPVQHHLDSLRTGELSPADRRELKRHLERCLHCRESFDELLELAEKLRGLMGELPSSFADRVQAAIGDHFDIVASEVGPLWVAFSKSGLLRIALLEEEDASHIEQLVDEYKRTRRRELHQSRLPKTLRAQIEEATRGQGLTERDVDLSSLAPFRRRVLEVLQSIPKGQVRSYAWVAREAGSPRAVRAVGSACATNPLPFLVPCHRVVPTTGGTGDYAYGPELKRRLLRREGVLVDALDRLDEEGFRYIGFPDSGEYCFPTCGGSDWEDANEPYLLLRDERDAKSRGLKPCSHCRPLAA